MLIENAKYNLGMDGENCSIDAIIDGIDMSVPLDTGNRHYAEILKQVDEGTITIAEAD